MIPFNSASPLHAGIASRALDAARLIRHDPITAIQEVLGWNSIECTWAQAKDFVYNNEDTTS